MVVNTPLNAQEIFEGISNPGTLSMGQSKKRQQINWDAITDWQNQQTPKQNPNCFASSILYSIIMATRRLYMLRQYINFINSFPHFQQQYRTKIKIIELISKIIKQCQKTRDQKSNLKRLNSKAEEKQLPTKIQHNFYNSAVIYLFALIKTLSQDRSIQPQAPNNPLSKSSQVESHELSRPAHQENPSQVEVFQKQACLLPRENQSILRDFFPDMSLQPNQNRNHYRILDQNINQSSSISIDTESVQKFRAADYARCSGLIKSIWYNRYGQVEVVAYATAFAISPRIIVSCAHGIYDKKRSRPCDKIYFVPSHDHKGYIQKQNIYESPDHNFLKYEPLNQNQKYGTQPIEKDLAVFIINRPFKNDCYLQLCDEQIPQNASLKIWGYPSKQIPPLANLQGMKLKRVDLNGKFVQKRDKYILVHSMPTLGGHSGSPIVRVTDRYNNQSIKVVGIHTHRGNDDTNQGLIMSRKLRQKVFRFAKDLCLQHNIPFGLYDPFQYQKIIQWVK